MIFGAAALILFILAMYGRVEQKIQLSKICTLFAFLMFIVWGITGCASTPPVVQLPKEVPVVVTASCPKPVLPAVPALETQPTATANDTKAKTIVESQALTLGYCLALYDTLQGYQPKKN